ncbi:hypothetical protein AC1031_017260 [Aphanomyces cochlioides]|nr:hypothetical protein AC1031_017260 [Aphanomyces cochlioides]
MTPKDPIKMHPSLRIQTPTKQDKCMKWALWTNRLAIFICLLLAAVAAVACAMTLLLMPMSTRTPVPTTTMPKTIVPQSITLQTKAPRPPLVAYNLRKDPLTK